MYVLEEMWFSPISPIGMSSSQSEEYTQALHHAVESHQKILELLPPEAKMLLFAYEEDQIKLQELAEKRAFVQGFRLGTKIMLDVFQDGEK